jgi:ribosomal protein S18 acetylase RimI-like enzyme
MNNNLIVNSTPSDIDTIFDFYDDAMAYQKKVFHKQWEGFDRTLIEREIRENRQWKIIVDGEIACIFVLTFDDAVIWGERDQQPSIFIHRIVTSSKFRGGNYVQIIIEWSKDYCKKNGKQFIRMDTWGDNQKLINYYVKCGFNFVEIIDLDNTEGLPKHYKGTLALFEIPVQSNNTPSVF